MFKLFNNFVDFIGCLNMDASINSILKHYSKIILCFHENHILFIIDLKDHIFQLISYLSICSLSQQLLLHYITLSFTTGNIIYQLNLLLHGHTVSSSLADPLIRSLKYQPTR